ncbi:asparagine synthase-related protein [Nocardia cyriacigeorgica]|uniref:asparagine synthase-related protein n=1 Tax=Nocardia cyriacigeorgica TaxID=135487 RepID=UPI002457496F|nr:asparagine synthase-related protein [Nocardia cyriacigeorgica]
MTAVNHPLAAQTGEALEQVADLRDIATPAPERRRLADPSAAAALMKTELLERLQAVFQAQAGDPVVLLSGGVDSIAVAAAAVALGVRPHAVTVSAAGGTDTANAAAAAAGLGLTHEVIDIDEQDVVTLAREAMARLRLSELWEVTYAIPLIAAADALDQRANVGPILTGSAADAILAGGKTVSHPLGSPEAVDELDQIIRKESANNFRYDRLVPDFQARVIPTYETRFIHVFQTMRFWEIAETFAPPALFGERKGEPVDKLCLRIACEQLLPESIKSLAWAKKSPIQRSAGIMGTLAAGARRAAAALPGAQTYTDPMTESFEAVATRLFLALLQHEPRPSRALRLKQTGDPQVTEFVVHYRRPEDPTELKDDWNERRLGYWLDAARGRGLTPTVVEVFDTHHVIGAVEVDGQQYEIGHVGRRMELQARPR